MLWRPFLVVSIVAVSGTCKDAKETAQEIAHHETVYGYCWNPPGLGESCLHSSERCEVDRADYIREYEELANKLGEEVEPSGPCIKAATWCVQMFPSKEYICQTREEDCRRLQTIGPTASEKQRGTAFGTCRQMKPPT